MLIKHEPKDLFYWKKEKKELYLNLFYYKFLLDQKCMSDPNIDNFAKLHHLNLSSKDYCLLMIQIHYPQQPNTNTLEEDWRFSQKLIETVTKNAGLFTEIIQYLNNSMVILLRKDQFVSIDLNKMSEELIQFNNQRFKCSLVYSQFINLEQLNSYYVYLLELKKYMNFFEIQVLSSINLNETRGEEEWGILFNQLDELTEAKDTEALEIQISKWLNSVKRISPDITILKKLEVRFILILLNILNNLFLSTKAQSVNNICEIVANFYSLESAKEKSSYAINMLRHYNKSVANDKIENTAILQAIHFIDSHYSEKITLTQISNQVYLNQTYFSDLFKKTTKKSFVEFITDKRMEKAKEHILNSTLKINNISKLVGYDDVSYFSTIFKKKFGKTPKQFREQII